MLSRTFSRRLMCAAISANLAGIGRNPPGHVARLCGQESQTASCLSHSAGIRKPSSAGVWFATGMVPPGLVVEALRQVAVGVDPAIAQEGPVRARRVDLGEVDRRQEDLLPRRGGPREDLAARALPPSARPIVARSPPSLVAAPLARIFPLVPATKLWPQNSIPAPPASFSCPTRLHTATKQPFATPCARWIVSHAPCCVAPCSFFSPGCQPIAVG